jgi:hypothetical protein
MLFTTWSDATDVGQMNNQQKYQGVLRQGSKVETTEHAGVKKTLPIQQSKTTGQLPVNCSVSFLLCIKLCMVSQDHNILTRQLMT